MLPDLWSLRRVVLPILERIDKRFYDDEYKLAFRVADISLVGTIDEETYEVRNILREAERVYPVNLASAQYIELEDGRRIYDEGSYAYRANGFFSEKQTHIRLFPVDGKTKVYAHQEYNPWVRPRAHYRGTEWNHHVGKVTARQVLGDHLQ